MIKHKQNFITKFKNKATQTIRKHALELLGVFLLLSVALLCLLAIKNYIGVITFVSGESMLPTLSDKQIVLSASIHISDVERNDIVLCETNDDLIIKRVVALPNDTVEIKDQQLIVNGNVVKEDYIKEPMETKYSLKLTLREGEYFVLGDNRNDSRDSRALGPISYNNINYVVKSTSIWAIIATLAVYCILALISFKLYYKIFDWLFYYENKE